MSKNINESYTNDTKKEYIEKKDTKTITQHEKIDLPNQIIQNSKKKKKIENKINKKENFVVIYIEKKDTKTVIQHEKIVLPLSNQIKEFVKKETQPKQPTVSENTQNSKKKRKYKRKINKNEINSKEVNIEKKETKPIIENEKIKKNELPKPKPLKNKKTNENQKISVTTTNITSSTQVDDINQTEKNIPSGHKTLEQIFLKYKLSKNEKV